MLVTQPSSAQIKKRIRNRQYREMGAFLQREGVTFVITKQTFIYCHVILKLVTPIFQQINGQYNIEHLIVND